MTSADERASGGVNMRRIALGLHIRTAILVLGGLAVLRLVSEQKDPNARGWWDNGVFQLE
jgi:hypothetical protein